MSQTKAPTKTVEDPHARGTEPPNQSGTAGEHQTMDGAGLQIGIVSTREHGEIATTLVESCRDELTRRGVDRGSIHEARVALPFELPYATKRLIRSAPFKVDAVVCLGCVVRGNSLSYEFISEAVARASMKIGMVTKTPVIYGLMTCTSEEQARECAGLAAGCAHTLRHGVEWAETAIEMARPSQKTTAAEKKACKCKCHE